MYLKLSVRYIRKYKKRSFVIFIGFLLAIIISCTHGIMSQFGNQAALNELKKDNQFHISVKNIDSKILDYTKSCKMIRDFRVDNFYDATDIGSDKIFNIISTESGKMNDNLSRGRVAKNKNELVAQEWVLKNLNKKIGDKISYKSYKNNSKYTEKRIVGALKNNRYDLEKGIMNFVTKSELGEIQKQNILNIEVRVSKEMRKNTYKIVNKLKKDYKVDSKKININKMLLAANETDGNYLKEILPIILVASAFSSIIIFSTYFVSIRDRVEDFAILRSLGIKENGLVKIIFGEIFLLFVPALTIGVLISLANSIVLTNMGYNQLVEVADINSMKYNINVPIKLVFVVCIIFLTLTFAIATLTYLMAVRYLPVNAISSKFNFDKKVKIKKINYKLVDNLSITNHIAFRYLRMDNLALFLVILCLSLAMSQIIYQSFINETNKQIWKANGMTIKSIQITKSNPVNERSIMTNEQVNEIGRINGVKNNLWVTSINTRLNIEKTDLISKLYFDEINKTEYVKEVYKGIYKEKKDSYIIKNKLYGYNDEAMRYLSKKIISGKIDIESMKKNNQCVLFIPKYYINIDGKIDSRNKILNYDVGDEITLDVPTDINFSAKDSDKMFRYWRLEYSPKMEKKTFKIAAIVDEISVETSFSVNSTDIIIPYDNYKIINPNAGYDTGKLILNDHNLASQVEKKLNKKFSNGSGFNVINNLGYVEEDEKGFDLFMRVEEIKFYAFIVLSSICLINILNYKILNKRKDIGIFRALGMTDGQIINFTITEAFSYAFISTVLAWIIGFLRQKYYLYEMETDFHITGLNMSMSLWIYIFIFIFCLSLCVFSTYLPVKKLLKNEITNEIRSLE